MTTVVVTNHPSFVELRLDRRLYRPGDLVTGTVTVVTSKPKRFDSIKVYLEGKTQLEVSAREVGLFEAFYSPPEPIYWVKRTSELSRNGQFVTGRNTYSFELALAPTLSRDIVETLKGLCIRTTYMIGVTVNRGLMSRTLATECELYVQVPNQALQKTVTPSNQFKFNDILAGEIQSLVRLGSPISGHLVALGNINKVQYSSVEVELVRVEDVFWGEDSLREICPVQAIQIADGMIPQGTLVPFFFVVPRLVVSPSYGCDEFQVSYFLNVLVTFKDGEEETRNIPITVIR